MDPRITIGGADTDAPGAPGAGADTPRPGRTIALVAVVGVALGTLFGVAFGSTASPPEEPATDRPVGTVTEPDTVPRSTTTTTSLPLPDRLALRVPGIVDTLVLVSTTLGGESTASVWEATDRGSSERALPAAPMQPDPSGQWLMTVTEGRFSDLRALWVGNEAWMEPVAAGVTAATWHTRFPGRIAWVETTGGASTLMTATFLPGRPARLATVGPVPDGSRPVWFGDTGILLEDGTGLTLVDEAARTVATFEDGTLLAGGTGGLLVRIGEAEDAGRRRVVATSTLLEGAIETAIDPDCRDGSFSPLGLVAMRCPHDDAGDWTLEVWSLAGVPDDFARMIYSESVAWVSPPAWSPDGRFVLYSVPDRVRPQSRLVFVDTSNLAGTTVVHPGVVTSLAMVRR